MQNVEVAVAPSILLEEIIIDELVVKSLNWTHAGSKYGHMEVCIAY